MIKSKLMAMAASLCLLMTSISGCAVPEQSMQTNQIVYAKGVEEQTERMQGSDAEETDAEESGGEETEAEETDAEETEAEETEAEDHDSIAMYDTITFDLDQLFGFGMQNDPGIPKGYRAFVNADGETEYIGPDGEIYTAEDLALLREEYEFDSAWLFTSLMSSMTTVEGSAQTYSYTGGVQTFEAPISGIYQFELYGGKGGSLHEAGGGAGGYSKGYLKMEKGEKVYLCVGGAGNNASGGYNGGGSGTFSNWDSGYLHRSCGGGGATSLTTTNRGVLKNYHSYRDEVLLVAAGGGGAMYEATSHSHGDEKTACHGSAGGGLSTDGYGISGSSGEKQPNSHYENANIDGVDQKQGYAFGQGQSTGDGKGAGGGGWFGGRALDYGSCLKGGGGGSSYIAGLPSFSFSGVNYESSTFGGRNNGSGYAVVKLTKILLDVQLPEEISKIELQNVCVEAQVDGMETYEWQMQRCASEEELSEDHWEVMCFEEGDPFVLKEAVHDGKGSISVNFTADPADDHIWFRMYVTGNDTEKYSAPCLVTITPLKMDHLVIEADPMIAELGDVLEAGRMHVTVIYNNEDVTIPLWRDDLRDAVYFRHEDQPEELYLCDHLTDGEAVSICLLHEDAPRDVTFTLQIKDTTPPKLISESLVNPTYTNHDEDQSIRIHLEFEDNANTPLTYWMEDEDGNRLTDQVHEGDLIIDCHGNTRVILTVEDESGNMTREPIDIRYVDTTSPEILSIDADHSEWVGSDVTITVHAKDDLSDFPEQPYSFDGGKTWQKEAVYKVKQNGTITVCVRDLVGNITTREIVISNIDHGSPSILKISSDPEAGSWITGDATICVEATDPDSGLAEEAFSFDDGLSWGSSPYHVISNSESVKISVRDRVGNISSASFRLDKSAASGPLDMIVETGLLDFMMPDRGGKDTEGDDQSKALLDFANGAGALTEETYYVETEMLGLSDAGEDNDRVFSGELIVVDSSAHQTSLMDILRDHPVGTAASGAAGSATFGFFFFVLWYRKCRVYRISRTYLEPEYLGTRILHHRKGSLLIRMHESASLYDGELLYIEISKRAQKRYDGKLIYVRFDDTVRSVTIHRNHRAQFTV